MLRVNLASNYAAAALSALIQIATIPLYLSTLGESQWGQLSWILALSSSLLIAEAGISIGVIRNVALNVNDTAAQRQMLKKLERRYFTAAICIIIAATVTSPFVRSTLTSNSEDIEIVWILTSGMAAAQLIGALYRVFLIGRAERVTFNKILMPCLVGRHALGLAAAHLGLGVASVVGAFLFGFAAEAFFRRCAILEKETSAKTTSARSNDPAEIPPNTGFLVLATALGAFGTQVDKLWFARSISSTDLGHYAIATTLSLAMLQLVYPITTALMPSLSSFADKRRVRLMRRSYVGLIGVLFIAMGGAWGLTQGTLKYWLPSATIENAVTPLFLLHLMGSCLNALCVPLYMALLASRLDKELLIATALAFVCQITSLFFLTPARGALAGSWAWCASNGVLLVCYFLMYKFLIQRTHALDR